MKSKTIIFNYINNHHRHQGASYQNPQYSYSSHFLLPTANNYQQFSDLKSIQIYDWLIIITDRTFFQSCPRIWRDL